MSADLSILETSVYLSGWISILFYAVFRFALEAKNYFRTYVDIYEDFDAGWSLLNAKKDQSDLEWQTVIYLEKRRILWILIYLGFCEIIRYKSLNVKIFQIFQIIFTLIFIIIEYGCLISLLFLFQPIFFALASKRKNKTIIWLANFVCLTLMTIFKKELYTEDVYNGLNYLNDYNKKMLIFSLFWTNLRTTSYNIECLNNASLLENLSFSFYFPTFFCGPFVPYEDYILIYKYKTYSSIFARSKALLLNTIRFVFWIIFTEFLLHFVYVYATFYQTQFINKMDTWTICGYGYIMAQLFHVKYVIMYGISTSIANFQNIKTPNVPKCVARIHLYSDMWRYFDPGLYYFIKRYIYVPAIKRTNYKILGSFLCFSFIYVWHGLHDFVLIWTVLNYLGIIIEHISYIFYKKYIHFFKYFGNKWERRFKCILATPLLCMSCISNFYFFTSIEIGNKFAKTIFEGSFLSNFILFLGYYFCCQVSTELSKTNAKK